METEKRKENNSSLRIDNCQLPVSPAEAHYTVYKLTDPEGKIYIGCTGRAVEKRWNKGHGYSKELPIRRAIDIYGWENFKKEILCEKLTKAGADKKERWFIAFYDSSDPSKGYNRFLGGLGKGARMSEVTKKVASASKNRLYEEHPEIKDKIRNTVNGLFKNDPTYRSRVGEGVKAAYEKDPTIKLRLREMTQELWKDHDFRRRVMIGMRKANENPELALKHRVAINKNFAEHPERREKISRWMKEYLSDPANRAFLETDHHPKPVLCVETGEFFPSQSAAERETGFQNIHKACAGRYLTAGGYHWRYAERDEIGEGCCSQTVS